MILSGILDRPLDSFDWCPAKIRFDLFIIIWGGLYRPRLHWSADVMDIFRMDVKIGEVIGVPLIAHTYGGRIKIEVFSPIFMVEDFNIIFIGGIFSSK